MNSLLLYERMKRVVSRSMLFQLLRVAGLIFIKWQRRTPAVSSGACPRRGLHAAPIRQAGDSHQ